MNSRFKEVVVGISLFSAVACNESPHYVDPARQVDHILDDAQRPAVLTVGHSYETELAWGIIPWLFGGVGLIGGMMGGRIWLERRGGIRAVVYDLFDHVEPDLGDLQTKAPIVRLASSAPKVKGEIPEAKTLTDGWN